MKNVMKRLMKDHKVFLRLFNNFKSQKDKNITTAKKIFKDFYTQFNNHIKIEEKVIRKVLSRKNQERNRIFPIAATLDIEHKKLLDLLDKISKSLKKKDSKTDVQDFYTTLIRHKNVEERLFYPKLDRELTDKEKIYIIQNIGRY